MITAARGAVVLLWLLCAAACGAASSTATTSSSPTALARPADPAQAMRQAAARTAGFHDVRYDIVGSITHNGQRSDYTGSVAATTNPPRIDHKNTPILGGTAMETIQDANAHSFCSMPQGGARQRFTDQTLRPAAIDPFSDIVAHTSGWTYLADVTATDGHRSWQLTGAYDQATAGATAAGISYQLSTITVLIDSRNGTIEQTTEHAKLIDASRAPNERTTTYQHFTYDTGLLVAAC